MIFRKIVVTAAIACLVLAFTACGDDDSSSFVEPEKESSDSGSVSSSSTNSSSSAKSSSSTDSKSSSSVTSSSSVSIADQKIPCDMPEHGIYHIGDEEFVCKDGFLVPYVPPSSSSAKVLPFKEKFKIDSVFNEEKTYGSFEDPRDGQIYRTIVIKTKSATSPEFEVFAQNLNYGTQVNLGTTVFDDNEVEKFCYDDDSWYCEHYFGGLYSWSETFGLPRACDSVWTGTTPNCPDSIATGIKSVYDWNYLQIQGICPEGWHVMNENEWRAMIRGEESAYRSISLASEGVNSNGFSALFGGGGYNDQKGCRYDHVGEYGRYWLPKENSDQVAFEIFLDKSEWNIARLGKVYGLSVRCVKDYSSL